MATATHTPGPWESNQIAGGSPGDPSNGHARAVWSADGETIVCYMVGSRPRQQPEDDVIDANARLIAAAPELLAALQALLHHPTTADVDADEAARCMAARAAAQKAIEAATL